MRAALFPGDPGDRARHGDQGKSQLDTAFITERQQTLAASVAVTGFGLFTGVDVRLEFCPAPPDHGIVFERTDLADPVRIPALIDFVAPQPRCTVITRLGVSVMTIEHVMAALAGLGVDNCLVRLNAAEPPAGDGSSLHFVEALLQAGIIAQDRACEIATVEETLIHTERPEVGIAVQPAEAREYRIGFVLDYGPGPIGRQSCHLEITPETFLRELAGCRTFVLEQEVHQLRSQGLALRATTENALVFNDQGPIDGQPRFPNECVRHKVLDCVGDFALLGRRLSGQFTAMCSGHRLNHEIIRLIRQSHASQNSHRPLARTG